MNLLQKGAEGLGIHLDARQIEQFGLYYAALAEWNQRANLTAIVDEVGVQRRHFLDSLTVSHTIPAMVLETGGRLMDVGAGAGFPGLPLKIAYPQLDVYLLDATAKKTAFLSHVGKALGLDGVTVLTGRAEELARDPALREAFDVVVSRAVSKMRVLAELTLPFARVGGLVIAQKGTGVHNEIAEARDAIGQTGGELREIRQAAGTEGALVVVDKIGPTPERYPRRTGIPSKRPL